MCHSHPFILYECYLKHLFHSKWLLGHKTSIFNFVHKRKRNISKAIHSNDMMATKKKKKHIGSHHNANEHKREQPKINIEQQYKLTKEPQKVHNWHCGAKLVVCDLPAFMYKRMQTNEQASKIKIYEKKIN